MPKEYHVKSLRSFRRHKAAGAAFFINAYANARPGESILAAGGRVGGVPVGRGSAVRDYITDPLSRLAVIAVYPEGQPNG